MEHGKTVDWACLLHQQNLQLYGIAVPGLDGYLDSHGVRMFREFRLQFAPTDAELDPISLKIAANPCRDTPYSFQNGTLYYQNAELSFPHMRIYRIPIPPEEDAWHLKGYTFPFRGSRNPYRELRINLKISGHCPGNCFFCHRTHSHRVRLERKFMPEPGEVFEQVRLAAGADVFGRISRVMFIGELYGGEALFLEAMQRSAAALSAAGYPAEREFNCCATEVRSLDGMRRLRALVRPARYSFSLEFFGDRQRRMGRYKGLPMSQVRALLENARTAGFDEIQLNYLAGIDPLDECERGFAELARHGLVDSVGLSTFTVFAEDEYVERLGEAWQVEYYRSLVEILEHYGIKAYHPDAYDMGCPYTLLMEKTL